MTFFKHLYILLLTLGLFCSCSTTKELINENPLKLISGEIFPPDANTLITYSEVKIQVKGAEKDRFTAPNNLTGEFEIMVRKDEVLIISYLNLIYQEEKITEDNTYFIHLTENKKRTKTGKIPH